MNQDKSICGSNFLTMVDTFQSLGFSINKEKSVFVPSQRIVFFGFILDSVLFKVFLPEEKIEKIIKMAQKLSCKKPVIIRDLGQNFFIS